MERKVKTGEFYRHFKDRLYQVLTVAEHSETGEELVIYQALYGDFKTYARPLDMFMSEVDHDKYPDVTQKYRFERVKKQENTVAASGEAADETLTESAAGNGEASHTGAGTAVSAEVMEAGQETAATDAEEAPDPNLLWFLDTEDWDERYNILVSLRDKMTDELIDSIAVSLDVVIPEAPLAKRYEELKNCLKTRQKYENQHLR